MFTGGRGLPDSITRRDSGREPGRDYTVTPVATSRASTAAGAFVMAVGLVVLAGWIFGLPALKSVWGQITMKANAAIGLLACGLALYLSDSESRAGRMVGRAGAVAAGVLGVLTLSEHLVGWNPGVDELLFTEEPGAAATTSPGRMGPNSSLSLTLGSIALLCLYRASPRAITCAQVLGALMAVLALIPVVGYLYGAAQLYALARYTGIALPTGIAFLVLSAGILAARPDAGPMTALMSESAHGVMARRLLVPAIIIPLLLGYFRMHGERLGLFDAGLGVSLFAVSVMVLLSATIWRTAVALGQSERARRSVEQALTETESRFRMLADQAPVLIWVEEDGSRVWFNRRWYEFTGMAEGDVAWTDRVHPDDLAECHRVRAEAARERRAYSHQYRVRRADGQFAWVLETASPRFPAGEPGRYVGSCVDVTDLRRAQQDRDELLVRERAAREEAEREGRSKDDFIAALSHELRTPLNAILGWMQMLQQGALSDARRREAIEIVARNAKALARLIEDLLDISRITLGRLELSRTAVDLNGVVRAAVESLAPSSHAKGIRIETYLEDALPAVEGDAHRLQQVVWNLVSNAVKFSPQGSSVEVQSSVAGERVRVAVRDRGDGIDGALLASVFERFRQGDSSLSRRYGGLGLGLSIVKQLTELHGGTVSAHSDGLGKGATFIIELPVVTGATRAEIKHSMVSSQR